jgi:hypothetical protein
MSGVEVDPNAVVATGSSMKPLAADVRGPGTTIGGLAAPAEPPLTGAFTGLTTAWSTALALLGQDMELLGDKVTASGAQYQVTEREIHSAFTQANQPPAGSGSGSGSGTAARTQ